MADKSERPQNKNLKTLSPNEARKNGKKGGEKSGEVRREKRNARETAKIFLELAAAGAIDKQMANLGVKEEERTNLMGVLAKHVIQAQAGNVNSARFVMEVAGELSKDSGVNINVGHEEDKFVFYIPDNGRYPKEDPKEE
jgi:hypothetical protein